MSRLAKDPILRRAEDIRCLDPRNRDIKYSPNMILLGLASTIGFTQQSSFSWKNAPNCTIQRYILLVPHPPHLSAPVCSCCPRTRGRARTPGPRHSPPRQPRRGRPPCSTGPRQHSCRHTGVLGEWLHMPISLINT